LSGILRQNEPKLNPLILLGNGILMTYTASMIAKYAFDPFSRLAASEERSTFLATTEVPPSSGWCSKQKYDSK